MSKQGSVASFLWNYVPVSSLSVWLSHSFPLVLEIFSDGCLSYWGVPQVLSVS